MNRDYRPLVPALTELVPVSPGADLSLIAPRWSITTINPEFATCDYRVDAYLYDDSCAPWVAPQLAKEYLARLSGMLEMAP